MLKDVQNFKNTTVHWGKTQADIIELLEKRGIRETRFTNISYETATRAGLIMDEDTSAIMLEFMKPITIDNGVGGILPVRMIIPNIPNDEKLKKQAYRIFWHYLKNKFIGIDSGLIEFEQEFMPHIALGKGNGIGNVWNAFKQKILPGIISGEDSDIALLSPPKK
ncbi:MAG TPA: hypothetical protein PLK94_01560 [Alphaproteobacteria bacterium]|nr:hypothetical protein [Alphaproteobacteria bacterium]HPQ42899.1 hypothetical protein [Syntrophales bacterium]